MNDFLGWRDVPKNHTQKKTLDKELFYSLSSQIAEQKARTHNEALVKQSESNFVFSYSFWFADV